MAICLHFHSMENCCKKIVMRNKVATCKRVSVVNLRRVEEKETTPSMALCV